MGGVAFGGSEATVGRYSVDSIPARSCTDR